MQNLNIKISTPSSGDNVSFLGKSPTVFDLPIKVNELNKNNNRRR